jgi:dihydroneopterin aldolase/2-amino-4-hydroxy-6-hydroxymethyldihydropteridine diphosphokinase/dihydropteroate synthase
VLVSLSIAYNLARVAESDDLSHTIDYSSICSALTNVSSGNFESLEALSTRVLEIVYQSHAGIHDVSARVVQLKPPLHSKAVGIESRRARDGINTYPDRFFCDDLLIHTIIGVAPCERIEKQAVILNICIERPEPSQTNFDFRGLTQRLYNVGFHRTTFPTPLLKCILEQAVSKSSYLTLEALTSFVALETLRHSSNASDIVTIKAAKPDALVFADSAEVEMTRHRGDYPDCFKECTSSRSPIPDISNVHPESDKGSAPSRPRTISSLLSQVVSPHDSSHSGRTALHVAAIALGTNMGDRFANIELALRLLEESQSINRKTSIIDTSFMYETAPMYITDQPAFINCACLVRRFS